jgi:hypothetical protein
MGRPPGPPEPPGPGRAPPGPPVRAPPGPPVRAPGIGRPPPGGGGIGLPVADMGRPPGGGGIWRPVADIGGRAPAGGVGELGAAGAEVSGAAGAGAAAAGGAATAGAGAAGAGGAATGAGAGAAAAGRGPPEDTGGRLGGMPGGNGRPATALGGRLSVWRELEMTRCSGSAGRGAGSAAGAAGVDAGAAGAGAASATGAGVGAGASTGAAFGASGFAAAGAGASATGAATGASTAGAAVSAGAASAAFAAAALLGLRTGFSIFGSSGCSSRVRPSRSARRRTRSACASWMLEECDFTSIPSINERSSVSLLVIPSSLASSWRRTFFGTLAISLSSSTQAGRTSVRRSAILSRSAHRLGMPAKTFHSAAQAPRQPLDTSTLDQRPCAYVRLRNNAANRHTARHLAQLQFGSPQPFHPRRACIAVVHAAMRLGDTRYRCAAGKPLA